MRVIKPEVITEGVLTSSSIPEPDASVGEVEWDSTRSEGKAVDEISDGIAIASDLSTYSVLGWNTTSLIATAYIYDSSFVYQNSIVFASGSPYISGNRQDICFDGSKYWFANGDQISRYNPDWTHDGTTINTDAEFFNAWAQAICSDGTFVYVTMRDNTDLNYFIAKYKISDSSFVESKVIQQNIEINIKGSEIVEGRILHFARFSSESAELSVYDTSLDLIGFSKVSKVGSRNPQKDAGLTKLSNGFATLNSDDKKINSYDSSFSLQGLYKIDDRVIKTSTHTQYQCTIATDDDPEVGVDKIPQTWVKIGATNKWKVFDEAVNTQSTDNSPLVMEFLPGQNVTAIAGFNLSGASVVNITVTDPVAGEVYNKDIALISQSNVVDWFTYYWSPIISRRFFIATDLPPYINATIKVTITGSGSVGIGALVFGSLITIGEANYGTSVAMQDLSRLSEDDFGNVTVTRRESRKLTNYDVTIENARKDYVYNILDDLRTIPSVWIGEGSQNDITVTYGYHYDLLINIDYPTICSTTLQVRGLV